MERKLFLGQFLIWVVLLLGQLHGCKSCIEKERKALLELKKHLISLSVEWGYDTVQPTWTNDTKSDCCLWEGLECNRTSGRVIGISIGDMVFENFSSPLNISLLQPFEDIRSLSLSVEQNGFDGFFDDVEGYKSLRRLRNLEILDLSSNRFNDSIFPFLNGASSLKTIFLHNNLIEGPFPAEELKDWTNLELLDLSRNFLNGSMLEFSYLKKLKALNLSSNDFSSSMELRELKDLINLELLSLAQNSFSGPIPVEVFCEMKNLRELDLSENHFVGQLPLCLGSLKKLRVLDLSSNQFSGNLPSSFSSLESLEYLSLLNNNFKGILSLNPLANLTKLKVLKLSTTSDMLQVESESTWQSKFQLSVAVLRSCSLKKIPSFFLYQKNLRLVDLSSNKLSGNVPTWLLENNTQLEVLLLQNNSFTTFQMPTTIVHNNLQLLDFSKNDIGGLFPDNIGRLLPYLVHMNGSNNGFQRNFPSSMGEMKNISFLDLSYNNFSGNLPRSFFTGCFSLKYLKLSHNRFTGHVPPRVTNFTSLDVLRLDNNLFTGEMGVGLLSSNATLSILDMSNNLLTGSIPSWISNLSNLEFLLLSDNNIQGTVPPSLGNMSSVSLLDLSGNLLSGAIPSYVGHYVRYLFLRDNNFTGPIPDTLLARRVRILDLRNNKLSGSIPEFVSTDLEDPPELSILLLRGNSLIGSIPRQLCDLRTIRILDLSHNKLSGYIPSCLYNLSFDLGVAEEDTNIYIGSDYNPTSFQLEYYKSTFVVEKLVVKYTTYHEIAINFATKERYDSYTGGTEFSEGILGYMYGMNLSSNELSGVIPQEIGNLSRVRALNLSQNFLSGSIPSSFSNLKDIESLDLSYNMLHGSIPQQLTSLISLAVFDVSYNNLSGMVPQGRQFNTFDKSSYVGNPLLCGLPTNISCDQATERSEEEDNGGGEEDEEVFVDMLVFYYSTSSTYLTALICILLLMCFDCPWRRSLLRLIDAFIASVKTMFP
ncbi:PREDICTED: LRR receptor-like serine/threonine-protein kinase GSO1 isoform X1 [Brassica oleracea var. oleracea]|uniref:LRR receptor-like serine/threonine-protein kinase GSO1 isoform X1 n=1 Tax=Brassica oleracea var. oleracea TaxID=109376 RepID=UPI0006A7337C|nr:PREDICTED: LRR receptor-like serine/threonine-protein kinase GSO1 isoform X1 [Brassica oleracea var. oleracea]